jgi:hypothetical protein
LEETSSTYIQQASAALPILYIDAKSFYASVECVLRGLDPLKIEEMATLFYDELQNLENQRRPIGHELHPVK